MQKVGVYLNYIGVNYTYTHMWFILDNGKQETSYVNQQLKTLEKFAKKKNLK